MEHTGQSDFSIDGDDAEANFGDVYDRQDDNGGGDGNVGTAVDLPAEVWLRILADPVAASSVLGVSTTMAAYGRRALADVGAAARRAECQTPQSCTRALICAIIRDDPVDLVRVLLSGVVDPTLPAIPATVSGMPTGRNCFHGALVAPLSCTAVIPGRMDQPIYFFEQSVPPLLGAWTPVTMAVAFSAPRALTALGSFGARPPTTTERLIAQVMRQRQTNNYLDFVAIDSTGTLERLPSRVVPLAEMVRRLLGAFGRRPILATADPNPLTLARENAMFDVGRLINRSTDTDSATGQFQPPVTPAEAIASALTMHTSPPPPLPADAPDDVQLRALADNLATRALGPWLDMAAALLAGGYSADERVCVFAWATRDNTMPRTIVPERDLAAALAGTYEQAISADLDRMRAATSRQDVIAHATSALQNMLYDVVIRAFLDAY